MSETMYSLTSDPSNPPGFLFSRVQTPGLSWAYLIAILLLYPTLVALLRHHRLHRLSRKYPYTTRSSFASMTNSDAFFIQQAIVELEFPFIFEKALQFALFRTYGIPTISKLLVQTSQFSEPATATKRYADTTVLITEFAIFPPESERVHEAIARVNYIHSCYQKAGKISNDDMLYTLALFACEPYRWVARYEWRELEDLEKCAIGTFWKSIGDAMGIGYEKLRSGGEGEEGWTDGLHWLDEIAEWSEEYEKKYMVPAESNKETAEQTVAILLWGLPGSLKPFGKKVVSTLMDDRLRTAMMYEKPPSIYLFLVSTVFTVRKYFLRYLCLPRPHFMRVHNITDQPSPDGTYHMKVWETVPWYIQPTVWNRYSLQSWTSWLMGLPIPGDEGDRYWPQGYKIHELGPDFMRGKGADYAKESRPKIAAERMKGCPFVRPKVG